MNTAKNVLAKPFVLSCECVLEVYLTEVDEWSSYLLELSSF